MKVRYVCLIVLFLCFCSVAALADSIPGDGTIKVGRGSDPDPSMSCNKTDFNINLNGHGGLIANCINTSGVDWVGLDIFAFIPSTQSVTCMNSLFAICMTFDTGKLIGNCSGIGKNTCKKEVEVELFGGAVITAGSKFDVCTGNDAAPSCFFINLNDSSSQASDAPGGWFGFSGAKNGIIKVRAVTPEPGTLLLFLSGAGVFSFLRRQRSA